MISAARPPKTTRHAASLRSSRKGIACLKAIYTRKGKASPPIKNAPYAGFAAVPLLGYRGLNPILPFLRGRGDAARRVVIKRMSEEHFNQALPVLRGAFFVGVASVAFFLPLAGACGRRGFWAWACARDSRDARVRAFVQGGRSASQAKAQGTSPGASFLSPPFFGDPKKGGGGGAKPPRRGVGDPAFCVTIPQEGKAPYSCMRARLMRGLSFGIRGCFGQSRSTLASHPSNCRVPPLIAVPRPPNPASRFRSSALRFYPTSLRFIKPRLAF